MTSNRKNEKREGVFIWWAGLELSLSNRILTPRMMQLFYLVYEQDWDRGTRENGGCMLSCWSDRQTKEWRGVTSDSRIHHKWQHLRIFPCRNCTTFYEKWKFCLNNLPPFRWVGRRLLWLIGKIVFLSTGLRLGIDSERVAVSYLFSFLWKMKQDKVATAVDSSTGRVHRYINNGVFLDGRIKTLKGYG